MRHTATGWWLEEAGPVEPTPPLAGETTADVVVVGGGYLGLWTAWHLLELEPEADVVVLEAGVCGHGPSGRNGGFVQTLWGDLPGLRDAFGDERALAVGHASAESVRAIGEWCSAQRGRRVVHGGASARRRDHRGAGGRLGTRPPRLPRAGARRGGRAERRGGPGGLRLAGLPYRRALRHLGHRPARAACARAAREAARARRPDLRALSGRRALTRRDGRDRRRPCARRRRGARGQRGHRRPARVPDGTRRRLQPHRPDRARPGRARAGRLDGRRGDRRLPHPAPLLPHDARRPDRLRLGRRHDGARRPPPAPARRRRGRRRPSRALGSSGSSRSSPAARSRTPGAGRSTSPPRTCRSSAAAAASTTASASPATASARASSAAGSSPGWRSTGGTRPPAWRSSSPTGSASRPSLSATRAARSSAARSSEKTPSRTRVGVLIR